DERDPGPLAPGDRRHHHTAEHAAEQVVELGRLPCDGGDDLRGRVAQDRPHLAGGEAEDLAAGLGEQEATGGMVEGVAREITGSRLQGLLALLAEDPHVGCSTSRLVDALWPDEQPEHPFKALQVLVSRARARLGPGVIVSTPGGYRLALRDDQIDTSAVLFSVSE